MPDPLWDEKGHRKKFVEALAWPDELTEQHRRENETRQAAAGAGAIGGGLKDEQWARAWDEYQRALAIRQAREQTEQTEKP